MTAKRLCIAACLSVLSLPMTAHAQGITQGFNSDGTPYRRADELLQEDAGIPPEEFARKVKVSPGRGARMRGLDTLNGSVSEFEINTGERAIYERLDVTLEACLYPDGNPEGEAFAFLQIRDRRDDVLWFSGWMTASSPALSALDHPRYDVWVLNCKTE